MKTRFVPRSLLAIIILTCATTALAQQTPVVPPDLDAYVQRVMKSFDVPGIALAVVKDDAVVVAKGYGVRKLGGPTGINELMRQAAAPLLKPWSRGP